MSIAIHRLIKSRYQRIFTGNYKGITREKKAVRDTFKIK